MTIHIDKKNATVAVSSQDEVVYTTSPFGDINFYTSGSSPTTGLAASAVSYVSGGTVSATNVQNAINELMTELSGVSNGGFGIDPRLYGAIGDGSTDDTLSIQATINSVSASGGVVMLPALTFAVSGRLTIPASVDIMAIARGSNFGNPEAAVLKLTSSGAGLTFGDFDGSSTGLGNITGGFTIDAFDTATDPLIIGRMSGRRFSQIRVENSAGDGVRINTSQNSIYEKITSVNHVGTGFVLDYGAGGNTFITCNASRCGADSIKFLKTNVGQAAGGYTRVSNNSFYACIFERAELTSTSLFNHEDGYNNKFTDCIFAGGFQTSPLAIPIIYVGIPSSGTNTDLQFVNCNITGTHTSGTSGADDPSDDISASSTDAWGVELEGAGATVILTGQTTFRNLDSVFKFPSTAGRIDADRMQTYNVDDWTTSGSTGSFNTIVRRRWNHPLEITRETTTNSALNVLIDGDTTPRFLVRSTGKIELGSGSGAADLTIERVSAGVLGISGDLIVNGSLIGASGASAITYASGGSISATNVQNAINELDTEKSASGHTHAASSITYTASGNVSATNVQTAIYQASLLPSGGGGGSGEGLTIFNVVSDYGASNTGSDATSAIQAAINAARDVSGAVVYFPIGTYSVSASLIMNHHKRTTLLSEARHGAKIVGTNAMVGKNIIEQWDNRWCTIDGFWIYGQDANKPNYAIASYVTSARGPDAPTMLHYTNLRIGSDSGGISNGVIFTTGYGGDDAGNELHKISHSEFYYVDTPIFIGGNNAAGGGNSLNHYFYNLNFNATKNGIYVSGGGSFEAHHMQFNLTASASGHGFYFGPGYYNQASHASVIYGEGIGTYAITSSPSAYNLEFHISNSKIDGGFYLPGATGNPDFILWEARTLADGAPSGYHNKLTISNCIISTAYTLKIRATAGSSRLNLINTRTVLDSIEYAGILELVNHEDDSNGYLVPTSGTSKVYRARDASILADDLVLAGDIKFQPSSGSPYPRFYIADNGEMQWSATAASAYDSKLVRNGFSQLQMSGPSGMILTLGDNIAGYKGQIQLYAGTGGAHNVIRFNRVGVATWLIYDAGDPNLYFRDVVNNKMTMWFEPGTTGLITASAAMLAKYDVTMEQDLTVNGSFTNMNALDDGTIARHQFYTSAWPGRLAWNGPIIWHSSGDQGLPGDMETWDEVHQH